MTKSKIFLPLLLCLLCISTNNSNAKSNKDTFYKDAFSSTGFGLTILAAYPYISKIPQDIATIIYEYRYPIGESPLESIIKYKTGKSTLTATAIIISGIAITVYLKNRWFKDDDSSENNSTKDNTLN